MDLNYLLYHHQKLLVRSRDPALTKVERARAARRANLIGCLVERYRSARIPGPRIPLPVALV